MRSVYLRLLLLTLLGTCFLSMVNAAEDRVTVQAILVTASREPGKSDPRLARYESTLQRILRFESFKFVSEGKASLTIPGRIDVGLARGHKLTFASESSTDGRLRLQVRWDQDQQALMRTGLVLRPNVPAVLGGPTIEATGEVYAVLIIAE